VSIAALRIDGERGGALKRAAVIAAALYLAIVQILSAAHAVPGKPDSPHHDTSACVLCVAAHGFSHGVTPSVFVPSAPIEVFTPLAPVELLSLVSAVIFAPSSRGPPSF
jgi:hypothetical protein